MISTHKNSIKWIYRDGAILGTESVPPPKYAIFGGYSFLGSNFLLKQKYFLTLQMMLEWRTQAKYILSEPQETIPPYWLTQELQCLDYYYCLIHSVHFWCLLLRIWENILNCTVSINIQCQFIKSCFIYRAKMCICLPIVIIRVCMWAMEMKNGGTSKCLIKVWRHNETEAH